MTGFLYAFACLVGPAIAWLLVLLVLHRATDGRYECPRATYRCPTRWTCEPKWFEPWWCFTIRHHLSWSKHMRTSPYCRDHVNHWLELRHQPRRWTESGRLK